MSAAAKNWIQQRLTVMSDPVTSSVYKADTAKLAQLIASVNGKEGCWGPEELGDVLRHQLSAPLEFGEASTVAEAVSLSPEDERALGEIKNLGDLFVHPRPPLALLKLAKDFAKSNHECPNGPLPKEVAAVIYFGAIVAALLRCGERITSLDDISLLAGFDWAVGQEWIGAQMRELFVEGRRLLSP